LVARIVGRTVKPHNRHELRRLGRLLIVAGSSEGFFILPGDLDDLRVEGSDARRVLVVRIVGTDLGAQLRIDD
jgi:hypothetical protein